MMNYSRSSKALFCGESLFDWLSRHEQQVISDVNSIPENQLVETDENYLVEHFLAKNSLELLKIYEDNMQADEEECHTEVRDYGRVVSVPSLKITITVPYTGPYEFWNLQPSTFRSTAPIADIMPVLPNSPGRVIFDVNKPSQTDAEDFKREIDRNLENIRFYLGNLNRDIAAHNSKIRRIIEETIKARKSRLEKHRSILDQLDLPIKPKADAPAFVPVNVKKIITPLPVPKNSKSNPEPGISNDIYEHILKVIRHEGRAWEKVPKTYAPHSEEDLRDFVLSHLNTHFEGDATGETFRNKGKTDICINEDDRAAFVAECKIWSGEKNLKDAVDQLLGYLTWRDCKTSLLIVNKKVASFSGILSKIPECLEQHPCFKKKMFDESNSGEWRYVFKSLEDDNREIIIHVFAFNLYTD